MQDQMIIFMALAKGESQVLSGPFTLHTETAIHIAQELTAAKFNITPIFSCDGEADAKNNNCVIKCTGVGLLK